MADATLTKDELITKLRETVREMGLELERIGTGGLESATVLDITGKYCWLSNGIYALNNNYKIGQQVLVYARTGQVFETTTHNPFVGELFTIDAVSDEWAEIRVKGERKLVLKGEQSESLKVGDVVLLDSNHSIVRAVIERAKAPPKISNPVTWDMIGGNEEAKQLLREAIEQPHQYPRLYAGYKQKAVPGILLMGPPGCGKTMLGKAAATSIGVDEGGFLLVKGPEVLNEFVGVSERTIRDVFAKARAFKQEYGKPAIIFIDEADALLTARGTQHNYMGQTIVPTFLAEMDGVVESGAIVILSTNNDHLLDKAVIRDGRVDFKVEVKRPGLNEAKDIMHIYMQDKPIYQGHSREGLVQHSTASLYEHALPHSGALIAGCVSKAITHALRRDIASGSMRPSGLHPDDFAWATQQIVKQELKHVA